MVVRTDHRLVRAKSRPSRSSTGPVWPAGPAGRPIVYVSHLISRKKVRSSREHDRIARPAASPDRHHRSHPGPRLGTGHAGLRAAHCGHLRHPPGSWCHHAEDRGRIMARIAGASWRRHFRLRARLVRPAGPSRPADLRSPTPARTAAAPMFHRCRPDDTDVPSVLPQPHGPAARRRSAHTPTAASMTSRRTGPSHRRPVPPAARADSAGVGHQRPPGRRRLGAAVAWRGGYWPRSHWPGAMSSRASAGPHEPGW